MASTNTALVVPSPSPAPAGAGDIRGLKGPVEIPSGWEWLWWTLGALAVALLAWWLWRWWKRRCASPAAKIVVPAHRRAKDRLRGALELISDPYAFCSLLSDVIRGYIEERFSYRAPERTTEEFLAEVQNSERFGAEHRLLLADFLERCDLVKFAKHEPTEPELRELYEAALRFIDETAERPTVEAKK